MSCYLSDRVSDAIDLAISSDPMFDARDIDWDEFYCEKSSYADLIVIRLGGPTEEYDDKLADAVMDALTVNGISGVWSGSSFDPIYAYQAAPAIRRRSVLRQVRQRSGI